MLSIGSYLTQMRSHNYNVHMSYGNDSARMELELTPAEAERLAKDLMKHASRARELTTVHTKEK